MQDAVIIQGRETTEEDVELIRLLIESNPSWGRTDLSKELCRLWNWRTDSGREKDMAARSFLLKLEGRGLVALPPRKYNYHGRYRRQGKSPLYSTEPITGSLDELKPVRVEPIGHTGRLPLFKRLIENHHYLGYHTVGESMKYMAFDRYDRPLACLLFGSAAWKCASRDEFIGWDSGTREANVNLLTNNTRFLILPWVEVPHLASHILGKVARRIAADWMDRYGHQVHLLETFVQADRFAGTCYRAANWTCVGHTRGRSRNDTHLTMSVPVKDVYVYPLDKRFREALCA
ncbi:MAG: DUF4338 domain-containing protein [Actinomycetia bacterium]|nr:DUF4338 domain-containing protein [Actinomycetes bacterium]